MSEATRRDFLKTAAAGIAATSLAGLLRSLGRIEDACSTLEPRLQGMEALAGTADYAAATALLATSRRAGL